MKLRIVTAVALAGALAFSVSGAQAATPVMDGKKVTSLTLTAKPGVQEHDQDTTVPADTKIQCTPPRCARLTFVYKPAKGIVGGLMFAMSWTNPASDFDLYVGEVGKRNTTTALASCGSVGNPSEKAYVAPSGLKSGKTYVMIMDFARSINDTVTGKVEINVPSSMKTTVPTAVDSKQPLNCTL